MSERDMFICGGSGNLTDEARAELQEFAEYLRLKAEARRLGEPCPSFSEWREHHSGTQNSNRAAKTSTEK